MLNRFSIATLAVAMLTLFAAPAAVAQSPVSVTCANYTMSITYDVAVDQGGSVYFRGPVTKTGGPNPETAYFLFRVYDAGNNEIDKKNLGGFNSLPVGATVNPRDIPKDATKNRFLVPAALPYGNYEIDLIVGPDNQANARGAGTVPYCTATLPFQVCAACGSLTASLPQTTSASLEAVEPSATPNPFRDATTITYAVVEDAPVSLRVYDVMGREVADLVSGTQAAGTHTATLRAGDLPGGTYIWRLGVGGEVTTGRMTLAR